MNKNVTMNKVREKIIYLDTQKVYLCLPSWDGGDILPPDEKYIHCHYTVEEAKEEDRGGEILEVDTRKLVVKHDWRYPHPMVRSIPKEYIRRL